jgi:hypothetical protein
MDGVIIINSRIFPYHGVAQKIIQGILILFFKKKNQGSESVPLLHLVFKVPGCSPDFRPKHLFFCDPGLRSIFRLTVDGAGE